MYDPMDKPLIPTARPASPWERIAQREAALEARIAKLEGAVAILQQDERRLTGLLDELMAALERLGALRFPNGQPPDA